MRVFSSVRVYWALELGIELEKRFSPQLESSVEVWAVPFKEAPYVEVKGAVSLRMQVAISADSAAITQVANAFIEIVTQKTQSLDGFFVLGVDTEARSEAGHEGPPISNELS